MRLFYDPHITANTTQHTLSEQESKHLIRVLRHQIGDVIGLLDGEGHLYSCEIIDSHPKKCVLKIIQTAFEKPESNDIHIAVAPTKQMERLEWFVEKAVEIGVTKITLIDSKNGERAKIKTDRLLKKAISAMKQSQRRYLPEIIELTSFSDFLERHPKGLIAHCYDAPKHHFHEVYESTACPILIGPEGDFTQAEVEQALEKGYKTITLGENRLRTETAALYACMRAKIASEE
jgi:16S rRNA (uracil1498-N3)-methyltransferase